MEEIKRNAWNAIGEQLNIIAISSHSSGAVHCAPCCGPGSSAHEFCKDKKK